MRSQINIRDRELPDAIRIGIRDACRSRGWRQAELVRIRGFDLVFVPRQVLPVVEAVIKSHYR